MNGRRYGRRRQGSLKAKVGIATAVVVAGGAIGVAVVATNHSPSTAASSAGYYQNRGFSQSTLLSDALGSNSWSSSFSSLSDVSSNSVGLTEMWASRHRELAVQRGVVVFANKKFVILESKNHQLHLWFLSGATKTTDVASSMSGTTALTDSTSAANTAMSTGNMTSAAATVASTTTTVETITPETTSQTYTVAIAGTGITVKVTVTKTTAVVVEKTTTSTSTSVVNAFTTPMLKRGDLALIAGIRQNGELKAQKILFEPLSTGSVTTPTTTPSATASSSTSTGTTTLPNGQTAETGNHS